MMAVKKLYVVYLHLYTAVCVHQLDGAGLVQEHHRCVALLNGLMLETLVCDEKEQLKPGQRFAGPGPCVQAAGAGPSCEDLRF